MRRTPAVMSVLAALAALAGSVACGPANHPATSPPSASTSASASPTPDRRDDIKVMVEAAALNLANLGVKKATTEETTLNLTMPCAVGLDAGYVATHYWSYRGAKIDVISHSVFGFDPQRGIDVIGQVRAALKKCKTWTYGDSFTMRILGGFAVRRPAGVDSALAYCHQGTIISGASKGDKVYLCDGLVSRGSLVTSVGTLKLTLSAAQQELKKALPLAAAALVKAVPGS